VSYEALKEFVNNYAAGTAPQGVIEITADADWKAGVHTSRLAPGYLHLKYKGKRLKINERYY
jgi:hypothetical protein